jgi:hypothetical protein
VISYPITSTLLIHPVLLLRASVCPKIHGTHVPDASKNNVVAGPAPPSFPNVSDHKPVDSEYRVVRDFHEILKLVRKPVEGGYPAVSHQDHVAQHTKIPRPNHSPRRVEPRPLLQGADMFAGRCEDFYIAVATAGHVIVSNGILQGIRYEQAN